MRITDQGFKIVSAHFFFTKEERDGNFMLSYVDPEGVIYHPFSPLPDVLQQDVHKVVEHLRKQAQLEFEGQHPARVSKS